MSFINLDVVICLIWEMRVGAPSCDDAPERRLTPLARTLSVDQTEIRDCRLRNLGNVFSKLSVFTGSAAWAFIGYFWVALYPKDVGITALPYYV